MNVPWMILPALLLEALFYFVPAFPRFQRAFGAVPGWLQAVLIWVSGVTPVLLLNALLGVAPEGFVFLAGCLAAVCLWPLVMPKRPLADLILMAGMAGLILSPWFGGLFPTVEGLKLGALAKLLWLRVGIAIFLFVRKFKVQGFGIVPDRRDWLVGLAYFGVFFGLLLPVGLYFEILRVQLPKMAEWMIPFAAVGMFVAAYLFIAYGEEFFFRGVLQPILADALGGKWWGLIVSSVCFGAVHLPYRAFPNWRFALLATVAGIFYGLAYEKARSLRAAMIAHAMVVTIWTVVFSRSL
ncbi:MAG: CPBP family intramembrane metalloprotease [Acidobacteria bacterium]|nr:CPBP family intramembrane metalloprotease [Acidobacteriota bacterium]